MNYLRFSLEELMEVLGTAHLHPYVHLLHWHKSPPFLLVLFRLSVYSTLDITVHAHDLVISRVLHTLLSVLYHTLDNCTLSGQALLLNREMIQLLSHFQSSLLQEFLLTLIDDLTELCE